MNAPPKRRVSCATLNRVVFRDGRLLVVLNKNRLKKRIREYTPFGGATEFYATSTNLQDSLEVTLEQPCLCELRLFVKETDLQRFEEWFRSKQGRETDPFRELYEELVEEQKLLKKLNRSDVDMRYAGLFIADKKSTRTGAESALTRYFFEVFNVDLSEQCWNEIIKNIETNERGAKLVSVEEIEAGRTSGGVAIAENCRPLIGKI